MRILFLTQICPYPPTNGGAIKTYNILRHLGARHEVHLLAFVRSADEADSLRKLTGICRSTDHCLITRSTADNLDQAARSIVNGASFIVARDWRPEMQAKVVEHLKVPPDLIYVDHLQMSQFVPDKPPCPVLLDEHNVEWRIIERFASRGGSPFARLFAAVEWRKLRAYELSACSCADRVLTVTAHDRDILITHGVPADKVAHLPIGVDTEALQPVSLRPESTDILSFGTMSWPPNIDAIEYFAQSIYPAIKADVSGVNFTVVGSNPPTCIKSLESSDPSVKVTGFVDDLRPFAERTAVFVVPLRIGSGMRVKILDAMAMGLPIVTTSVGCEGIDLQDGEHALIADTPSDFASAVTRLLKNPDERLRLAASARRFVEERYSWPLLLRSLDAVLASI